MPTNNYFGNYVDPDGMNGNYNVVVTSATSRTLLDSESNSIFICTKSSGNQTFTLPAATTVGEMYTFVCADAAGEILINPGDTAIFVIKASEGGASVVTATSTGVKNTAATNVKGDRIGVVSDGAGTWYSIEQSGIWATQ